MMIFYRLTTDIGKRKRFAYGISFGDYPSKEIYCSSCGRKWNKNMVLDEDLTHTIVFSHSHFPDISEYELQKLVYIKVKDIFTEEQIKGYHLSDNIYIRSQRDLSLEKGKELCRKGFKVKDIAIDPPFYYRFFHDGYAELDEEKSKIHLLEECNICSYKKYVSEGRSYLDTSVTPPFIKESSWDGSDFFKVIEMSAVIFCTERVYEIYKKYKLTGLLFTEVACSKG